MKTHHYNEKIIIIENSSIFTFKYIFRMETIAHKHLDEFYRIKYELMGIVDKEPTRLNKIILIDATISATVSEYRIDEKETHIAEHYSQAKYELVGIVDKETTRLDKISLIDATISQTVSECRVDEKKQTLASIILRLNMNWLALSTRTQHVWTKSA